MAGYPLLFSLRHLDDNRLTSWNWTLAGTPSWLFLTVMLATLGLAWWLSRWDLPRRWGGALVFTCLFALLAPLWRTPEVILDTGRYFTYSQHAANHSLASLWREWGHELPVWTDLPGVPRQHRPGQAWAPYPTFLV